MDYHSDQKGGAFIPSQRYWKVLSFLTVAALLIWVIQTDWFSIFKSGDIENIRLFLKEELYTTLFITLLLMSIQNLFTVIPIVGIIVINIALFGFIYGYVWSLATSIAGGLMAFIVYRYWFQSLLIKKVKKSYIDRLEQNGFFFVFLMRVIPFIPSSVINLASGVSSIKLVHFLAATLLGNALYLLLLSFIANGLLAAAIEGYLLIALLLAFIPSLYLSRNLKRKTSLQEKQKYSAGGE
jgi:uncharacterized membrane protein YdjX (TVP38/TMEM64 family)